jgi:hypothetical protein
VVFRLHESARPHGRPWPSAHVSQRGNRRGAIFFEDGNQKLYCDMLGEQFLKFRVEVWAYCRLGRPMARRAPGRKAVAIPVSEQLNYCNRVTVLASPY